MTATLIVTELAADHRRYTLDCEHATTTLDYLIAPLSDVTEAQVLVMLRSRHRETCPCGWVVALGAGDRS